jgi:hypothetical protein
MEHELLKPFLVNVSKERSASFVKGKPSATPAPHPLLDLQRRIGNRAVGRILQAKLAVSDPGDAYEQEAEHLAARISALPTPETSPAAQRQTKPDKEEDKKDQTIQRHLLDASSQALNQRQTLAEEDKDKEKKPLQRTSTAAAEQDAANGVLPNAEEAVSAASSSAGQALPTQLQRKFEHALGADLSAVRVHTGTQSAKANDAISARAYTTGNDIHFNRGEYNPSSSEGQHLLAHEVVHTVQQNGGGTNAVPAEQPASVPDDLTRGSGASGGIQRKRAIAGKDGDR